MKGTNHRLYGVDIVKTCAIYFVIAGHFFINTDLSNQIAGSEFVFMSALRRLFSVSVPLFIITTGFLNSRKKLSLRYYFGGFRVLLSYMIASIITILYEIKINYVQHSVWEWLIKVTDFTAVAYGWYIEMWIGLFLLIPFLNVLWESLSSIRQRQQLLYTLLFLTAIPAFINRPNVSLLPDFWRFMYPLLFYYIGVYIREYSPRFKNSVLIPILALLCLINPLVNIAMSNVGSMNPGNPFGLMGVLISTIVFLILYHINIQKPWLKVSFLKISVYSLDMYLISYLIDNYLYSNLYPVLNSDSISAFFVISTCVFMTSFVYGLLKSLLIKV